ncbi:S1 RNA-binding domain-containing protein, partial [Oleiphilus sp. HI0123]
AVTNVTHFGAFVDIGVHQDGLVHISALADKFVKDPRDVVKTGDIVKVKVMEADPRRKRISLSMRMGDEAQMNDKAQSSPEHQNKHSNAKQNRKPKQTEAPMSGAMANAFSKLKLK